MPHDLLRVSEVSKAIGLAPLTIIRYCNQGKLTAVKSIGGHRRFCLQTVREQLGWIEPEEDKVSKRKISLLSRVSSRNQNAAGNLKRQTERLLAHILEVEGVPASEVLCYVECVSAFGKRPILQRLIEDLIAGDKISKLYVEHKDRFFRLETFRRIIETIAEKRGTEIIYLDNKDREDEIMEFALDLTEFVSHLSATTYGKRGSLATKRTLSVETISRIFALYREAVTIKEIHKTIVAEGHKTEQQTSISMRQIVKVLNNKAMRILHQESDSVPRHIVSFLEGFTQGGDGWIDSIFLYNKYRGFCLANNVKMVSRVKLGWYIQRVKIKSSAPDKCHSHTRKYNLTPK